MIGIYQDLGFGSANSNLVNHDGSEQKIIGSVEELIQEILLSVKQGIMKKILLKILRLAI